MSTNCKSREKRGFAVVEMETDTEEVTAIQALRDIQGMDYSLKVNRAKTFRDESLQDSKT